MFRWGTDETPMRPRHCLIVEPPETPADTTVQLNGRFQGYDDVVNLVLTRRVDSDVFVASTQKGEHFDVAGVDTRWLTLTTAENTEIKFAPTKQEDMSIILACVSNAQVVELQAQLEQERAMVVALEENMKEVVRDKVTAPRKEVCCKEVQVYTAKSRWSSFMYWSGFASGMLLFSAARYGPNVW